jgi:hypothetical protein
MVLVLVGLGADDISPPKVAEKYIATPKQREFFWNVSAPFIV